MEWYNGFNFIMLQQSALDEGCTLVKREKRNTLAVLKYWNQVIKKCNSCKTVRNWNIKWKQRAVSNKQTNKRHFFTNRQKPDESYWSDSLKTDGNSQYGSREKRGINRNYTEKKGKPYGTTLVFTNQTIPCGARETHFGCACVRIALIFSK